MTRHEMIREEWKRKPERFTPEDYAKGWPKPVDKGFAWTPWPEGSDMPHFAFAAAKEMLAADPEACPLDVCDFALRLRRTYILESLRLPTDPQSLNLVRHMENIAARDSGMGHAINSYVIMEAVAGFVNNMAEKVRRADDASKEERDKLEDMLKNGKVTVIE